MTAPNSQENVIWKSFYEELSDMPFQYRCIVLGIVMGTDEREIKKILHLTNDEYAEMAKENNLNRWKFLTAVINA